MTPNGYNPTRRPRDRHTNVLPRLERWLEDGHTWIGGFENVDLSSRMIGRRVLIPFDDSQFELAAIGSQAPELIREYDGLPWQYRLQVKLRDARKAVQWMTRQEDAE